MILGVGIDLCDIRRIERTLEKYGDRFARRCFTQVERDKADGRARRAETYAKRFAAKEACAKALGTGLARGVWFHDIGVVNDAAGKPGVVLQGAAAARLADLCARLAPAGATPHIHLTLTDEYPYAQAQVLIEAVAPCVSPEKPAIPAATGST
ncbi:holo-[acyl-carrier protein] synthase [Rhodoblastus acidophilus]|uniref:Holo-[acyl-carrier-protein] synthase n=1 Tax=Rhodoblastus acidophilus TaxID=1074 RepID=A0A212RGH0_RHOAC|nr:holo-ACP synthase [Rhodoblastus acidophilus]MCW2316934.1 holo-[acyl-carrier protein] synthase [Rhodoblastus acidophilus]PPQ39601.1 holo-ACP synthase [Rhodoblastus acidophilus]RAI24384.1 holo-ACP synthase [Rhodoblastus acidophilus]SNB71478.1 holo-[acyl-carrier protein] synthase [Rhodoblastus acidophilus]